MLNLGYSISYPELRKFLTSAAEHGMNRQRVTPSGGIVPSHIAHRSQGGELIVAVADNWDHNERTVDGKQTTHAMTSLLMSNKTADFPVPRLIKSGSRTFNAIRYLVVDCAASLLTENLPKGLHQSS
ncbi:hypothetical protein DPMN_035329 [Dreissena polymorpha]|uniref:Uncharacterized protein n=1 Tax=Dreissena polymorpha TaxID=45954 RepID=A0A9D4RMV9_DREPO|nr:hypothetical protein DPMN_035329 [Dreissena polymorpha]